MRAFAIAPCLVALALPVCAQDGPSEADLVKVAIDAGKDTEERAHALQKARSVVYKRDRPREGPLKEEIGPLLRRLGQKADDVTQARLQAMALQCLKPYSPWPDLESLVRPFLDGEVALRVRIEALVTIRDHGAKGLTKELTTLLSEPLPRKVKERFELTVLDAAKGLTDGGGVSVTAAALDGTKFRTVKLRAARNLAEMRGPKGRAALLRAADAGNRDEHVSSTAALSLLRYGTLEGIGQLVTRLKQRRGRSVALYKAICRAAFREDTGFAEIPPEKYFAVPKPDRNKAFEELMAWWGEFEGKTPEDLLFQELRAKLAEKGVNVPRDKESKATVDALIQALGVEPLSLRYAALDLLIELTGRADMFEDFRSILINLGPNRMKLREWEPTYGFTDPPRQLQLRKEQARKAKKFQDWWESVRDRAQWVGGQWKVSG